MSSGIFKHFFTAVNDLIRFFIIYTPGTLGRKLRYFYYRKRFKRCGKNVVIEEGVIIEKPESIIIGDNVWIDKYSILLAGLVDTKNGICKKRENRYFTGKAGELTIGSGVHIGMFNILQAHGGISIGNNVTTSAGVKVYSLSNYPCDENNTEVVTFANCMVPERNRVSYILSPVLIEDGVWIALDCLVLGGRIGRNSFVSSQSLVYRDIPENSYASGRPAKKIKERFRQGK
jgi:galactoside O-acetyltransferase